MGNYLGSAETESVYIGQGPGLATHLRFKYIADESQTTFSGSDENSLTLSYTPNFESVFVNGVLIDRADYTASDSSSIVFDSGLSNNDVVIIDVPGTFSPADALTVSGNLADIANTQAAADNLDAVSFAHPQSRSATEKAQARANISPTILAKSSTYLAVSDDHSALFILTNTATFNLTAATTLGNGWKCFVRNNGTGVWTLKPDSETIDGLTALKIYPGESCEIFCNGSVFFTIGLSTMPLLESIAAASASAVAFTRFDDDRFVAVRLIAQNLTAGTPGQELWVQFSSDGGSSWVTTASYDHRRFGYAGSAFGGGVDDDTKILVAANVGGQGIAGTFEFWPAINSQMSFDTSGFSSTGTYNSTRGNGNLSGVNINAVRLLMSSGTINGAFRFYGIIR